MTTSSRVPFGVLIVHSKLPDGVMPSLYMQRVTTMANASAFSSFSLVTTSLRCVFLICVQLNFFCDEDAMMRVSTEKAGELPRDAASFPRDLQEGPLGRSSCALL